MVLTITDYIACYFVPTILNNIEYYINYYREILYPFGDISKIITFIYRVIPAVCKQIITLYFQACTEIICGIRIEKSSYCRVIVPALQVIQPLSES